MVRCADQVQRVGEVPPNPLKIRDVSLITSKSSPTSGKTGLMEIDGLFVNRSAIIQKVRIGRGDESSCAAKIFPGPIAIAPNFFRHDPVRARNIFGQI
jgi:hypothetical protein